MYEPSERNDELLEGSILCAWLASVNAWKIDDDCAAALVSSVNGFCTASRPCIEASKSNSREGVMLNCASACFTAACTKAYTIFSSSNLISCLVGCTFTSTWAGSSSINNTYAGKASAVIKSW